MDKELRQSLDYLMRTLNNQRKCRIPQKSLESSISLNGIINNIIDIYKVCILECSLAKGIFKAFNEDLKEIRTIVSDQPNFKKRFYNLIDVINHLSSHLKTLEDLYKLLESMTGYAFQESVNRLFNKLLKDDSKHQAEYEKTVSEIEDISQTAFQFAEVLIKYILKDHEKNKNLFNGTIGIEYDYEYIKSQFNIYKN